MIRELCISIKDIIAPMLYSQFESSQRKVHYQEFPQLAYMPFSHPSFSTLAVHAGQQPEPVHGSVNVPIHMSSTFAQRDISEPYGKFDYTRGGNPTRQALEQCLSALEKGKHTITFSSGTGGMATILHTLQPGDHILICQDAYSGTQDYIRKFTELRHCFEADFTDLADLDNLKKGLKKNTRLVWTQSVTNPMMQVLDIASMVEITKAFSKDIIVVTDNTFASPVLVNPLELGADVAMHSLSKYVGGHGDLLMGALVFKDKELHDRVLFAAASMGACPSPLDCFLVLRGVKTLEQRMVKCTKSAYHIAHFLQKHKHIETVLYPGLKDSKFHQQALKQMRGFGGMMSIRVKGGKQQVSKFLRALKVFTLATSLGDVESLAQCPAFMSHRIVPKQVREKVGITDSMVRLSIGQESTEDLIEDLDQALRVSQQ